MSEAQEALADVRGWLCDNLSDGDAGEVCGMLSVVSRHINELENENAELKKAMDFQALELGCMTHNRDVLHAENAKLRELVSSYASMSEYLLARQPMLLPYKANELQELDEKRHELGIEVE
ncbi:MAG: hypothetical protein IKG21_13060 [Atopobiaceae bacterium]|nr:hypothetical protein [Atopobiaceae bacterium]